MKTTTGTTNNDVVKGICFSARRILGVVWLTLLAVCSGAFAQVPDAGMVNKAGLVGIAETTRSYDVSVADYNRDGWQDFLFLRGPVSAMRLYTNNRSGRFVEDKKTAFVSKDQMDCAWGDPNGDKRPDFYCSVGGNYGTGTKANQLWIQQPDGTFVDQAALWGVTDRYGRGRQVTWFNFNGDQFPDLFVGNTFPRQDSNKSPNRIFVNGNGKRLVDTFVPGVTVERNSANICAFAADIDRDGYDDLFLCGCCGQVLQVLRNIRNPNGTRGFMDVAPSLGLANFHSDVVAADLNKDGKLDLVLVSLWKVSIRLQTGYWKFGPEQVISWTLSRWVAVADLDGDGDRDIYVTRSQEASYPYTTTGPNPFDLVLRNNGYGKFSVEKVGSSTQIGVGGRCAAIDHDRDGRSAILVVNSIGDTRPPGPLELMVPPPKP